MTGVDSAARAAGRYLAGEPFRVPLDTAAASRVPMVGCAIYLAVDARGVVDYIGKVDRRGSSGVATRLAEHLRQSRRKRQVWRWLWVVPLTAEITAVEIAALERSLIRAFRPLGNVQHARAA